MLVFNTWYYSWAPSVAHIAVGNPIFSAVLRVTLVPLFGILFVSSYAYSAVAWYSPEGGAIIAGFVSALLIGAVYIPAFAFAVARVFRGKSRAATILLKPFALCIALSTMLVGFGLMVNSFPIIAIATLGLTLSSFTVGVIGGTRVVSYALHWMIDWASCL